MAGVARQTKADLAWSTSDVTRIFGFTPNYVAQLVKSRTIVRNAAGKFDQSATVQAILQHREETLRARFVVDGADRARLAKAKASMAELALAQRQGEVVNVDDVTRVMTAVIVRSKMRLLTIPHRLAPRLCTVRTAVEAEQLITDEIYLALTELAAPKFAEEVVATLNI
jgi:phage terminase Nu1 subunit (DNA packaging protein)